MNKYDIMKKMSENNNGYFFIDEAVKAGISKSYAEIYTKKNKLKKVAKGIYISDDAWEDFQYILSKKYKSLVFSHETALDIHGLSDRKSCRTTVTVNRKYNATNLRKLGCAVYTVVPELHKIGVVKANTFWGNEVNVYDIDRTICDIIKCKNDIPYQSYRFAIQEYFKVPQKNIKNLLKYAKLLKVEQTVKNYIEVFL